VYKRQPLDGEDAPELVTGKREARLVWRSPEGALLRQLVLDAASARPLRTEIYGGQKRRQAVVCYRRPAESGSLHPVSGFRVRGAGSARFRMEISFRNMQINGPVSQRAFKLKPPPGVEVIEAGKKTPEKK